MRHSSRFILLLIFVVAGACGDRGRPEANKDFGNYKPLAAAVAKADRVVLYEGLPHQKSEKKLLDEELKTKKSVQFHGFHYYAAPLPLKERDAEELTKLFTSSRSFEPYTGPKKCGGFHPDYCIEWHVDQEVYRCAVCFGCYEVMVFGPSTELYCNMVAGDEFKKILQPYATQRPASVAK